MQYGNGSSGAVLHAERAQIFTTDYSFVEQKTIGDAAEAHGTCPKQRSLAGRSGKISYCIRFQEGGVRALTWRSWVTGVR